MAKISEVQKCESSLENFHMVSTYFAAFSEKLYFFYHLYL